MRVSELQRLRDQKATLYRVVFDDRRTRFVVVVLFAFFVLNPAVPVFAAEAVVASSTQASSTPAPASPPSTIAPPVSVPAPADTTISTTSAPAAATPVGGSVESSVITSLTTSSSATSNLTRASSTATMTNAVATTTQVKITNTPTIVDGYPASSTVVTAGRGTEKQASSSVSTTTLISADPVVTTTGADVTVSATEPSATTSSPKQTIATTTTLEIKPPVAAVPTAPLTSSMVTVHNTHETLTASTSATTTTTSASSTQKIVYVPALIVDDSNRYQFSVNDCMAVSDGSFFCKRPSTESSTTAIATAVANDQVVFAAPDKDGDSEIYFNNGHTVTQITHNLLDDSAPQYDPLSNTIVWQRMINGRYQIMSYDVKTKIETQLTDTQTNNMEPSRNGSATVWQQWIGSNWEIILNNNGTTTQITNNTVPDIAPQVQNGYVIWNTVDNQGHKRVAVYDITSGITSYIADSAGGQVLNPRFVLVYDTKYANGDSVTKGYDPATGMVVPLSAEPGPSPKDLPSPNTAGQPSALLQNNSTSTRGDKLVGSSSPSLSNGIGKIGSTTATTTGPAATTTIITTNTVTATSAAAVSVIDMSAVATSTTNTASLTKYDLVIPGSGTTPDRSTSTQNTVSTGTSLSVK